MNNSSRNRRPLNLILLGDPGAGKATQAPYLAKRYGLYDFDFGKWLRDLRTRRARSRAKLSEKAEKGMLTPTRIARAKFKEVIFRTPASKGILFNGNPRMLGEAKLMASWFREADRRDPLVIYLAIPRKELLRRVRIRAEEEGRSDDDIAHVRNRMKYYKEHIPKTVAFLRRHYPFKKVSGLGSREAVRKRLIAAIEALKRKAPRPL